MSKKSKKKRQRLQILSAPLAVIRFFKEARDELKKVSWPTRETTVRYTIIIITSSVVVGFIVGGIDYIFSLLIEKVV